ncbi:MAG TPA: ABC transporter substrate-binding protein [Roseiflexaceae bacterium]|nr:ABC transporter substrate-binding protein [Roseiflexaceae bacterium]
MKHPWRFFLGFVALMLLLAACGQGGTTGTGSQAAATAAPAGESAAPTAAAAAAPSGTPLKVGYSTWVGYGPLFVAQDKKFYEQNGVAVELNKIEDPKLRFAALAAGQLDGLVSTLDALSLYYKPDLQIQAVLALDTSSGGDGIVAKKDIKSVADLKGRTVAYNPGSVSDFYLNYVLQEAGLTIDDVKGVSMKQDDAGAALVAGKVDAAVTWEPWLSKAKEAPDGQVLIDSSKNPGLIVDVLIFRKDVIEKRKADVQAVIKSWMQANDYYKSNKDDAVAIMAKSVGGWLEDPKVFAETLTGVQYYDEAGNKEYFAGADAPVMKTAQFAIDLWAKQGKVDKALKATDIVDNSLVVK